MPTKKSTRRGTLPSTTKPLVDQVELFAIGVDSLNAKVDRTNYSDAYAEDNKEILRRIDSTCRVSDYSPEHFDIAASLYLRVEAKGFKDPILFIDTTISGHFHPKTTLSREDAEKFAAGEARLIFWPYFRQLVSDTTARMHVATITLPLAASYRD